MHLIYKQLKYVIAIGAVFLSLQCGLSQSLVKNGSFEVYDAEFCNESSSLLVPASIDTLPAKHWYSIDNGDVEYYRSDTVLANCSVTTELWFNYPETFDVDQALDGNAWIGMNVFQWNGYSERITGQLIESLKKDSLYEISFYIKRHHYSSFCLRTIGMQFFGNPSDFNIMHSPYYSQPVFLINIPDIEFNIDRTCDFSGWIQCIGIYEAIGGENYFTIGYYYPKGFDWSSAFNKYIKWSLKEDFNQLRACKKLVRRAPDIDFSSNYIHENNSHEISYYYIDNVSITRELSICKSTIK